MASRSLDALHPECRGRVGRWLAAADLAGIDVLVYCTERTLQEQAALYTFARTAVDVAAAVQKLRAGGLLSQADVLLAAAVGIEGGKRKTNAPPGLSFHHAHSLRGQTGALACDFVPLVDGKPEWNAAMLYQELGEMAEHEGLTWAGRWDSFRETCHVQWDEGQTVDAWGLARGEYA
jgi:peptidoglycan L-alanyl-D-glutamate endopeptidase CwlK